MSNTAEFQEKDDLVEFSFNGLLFSDIFVPEEVVITILSFVPWPDLPSCRLVCTTWNKLIGAVCQEKLKNKCKNCLSQPLIESNSIPNFGKFPFHVNYAVGKPNFGFGFNLMRNIFGNETTTSDKFTFWKVVESRGDGWRIESYPYGSDPLPKELGGTSCFATSYGLCYKAQLVDISKNGLNAKIMDEVQPDIQVSEWYAARFDCGCVYRIKVVLLNADKEPVAKFEDIKTLMAGTEWYKISYTFQDYGPGVRYVLFGHGGKDTQYWAGHYGSKMAGAEVVALLPHRVLQHNFDSN